MTAETIWKFPLDIVDAQAIRLGAQAVRVLACGPDGTGTLCIWVVVNPDGPKQTLSVLIVGTGHPMPDVQPRSYVGSATMPNGLVWHVFIMGGGAAS